MILQLVRRLTRIRWLRSLLGVLVLAALIWVFGPLLGVNEIHPLQTEIARYIAIGLLLAIWAAVTIFHELRLRHKAAALATDVAEAPPNADETASREEVALLAERLRQALKTLRRPRAGGDSTRRPLAALPWYMFIGPPGAGKTTALLNCGLRFPLADDQNDASPSSLRGVGGTRNCEWWFTDDGVLIDTAGRYTTQDSNVAVDAAAWLGFLRLLKKHRRREPLNGLLVAISLTDLSVLPETERVAHARAIRKRVREVQEELAVRIPVYVLFTKADLIAGFVEIFASLSREEREQVWGMTFPLDDQKSEGGAIAAFTSEFDLLVQRLNDRVLERVHQEPDLQRRRLIYGFPQQVASLRDVAAEFLSECFRPSRLEARPLLRGIYFTSGTQNGTPIDRLVSAIASDFGMPLLPASAFSGAGRSYFLARLIREVIFGEAALVRTDPKAERRIRWTRRAAYTGCGLLLVALGAAWFSSYIGNRDLIAQVHAGSAAYNAEYAQLVKHPGAATDFRPLQTPLDALRGIHGGYAERGLATPIALTFGLYQGTKLSTAANEGYTRTLNRLLLPRLLARLEAQIASKLNSGNADILYQLLKTYLILGRQGPMDADLVMAWLNADLLATYPSEDDRPLRESIAGHAEAMLQPPLTSIPLNDLLIAQVRAVLNKEPVAEFSYKRLLRSKRVTSLPAWTVQDNGGPGASRVFQLRSGKPLDSGGVPGVYTWAAYNEVFKPLLVTLTQDISDEGWVLGRSTRGVSDTIRDANKLRRDVMALYLDDYTRQWDRMLADIATIPFASMQEGLDQLGLLAGPSSPLRDLLTSIDAQTQLSRTDAANAAVSQTEARAARIASRAAGLARLEARAGLSFQQLEYMNILSEAFGVDATGKPVDPAKRVDDHFRALHDFVTASDNRPAPIEASLQKMEALYQSLNQTASTGGPGQTLTSLFNQTATGNTSPVAQLQALTREVPPQITAMLQPISPGFEHVLARGASQDLSQAWNDKVAPLCQAASNRYPFLVSSDADIPADDFVRLLGPGGAMDQFFEQYLKAFVDASQRPWRWRAADRAPPGVSLETLATFERAAQIREALFAGGAQQVLIRFELVPVELDPGITKMSIEIGGQSLTWDHNSGDAVQFQWPGQGGKTNVRISVTAAGSEHAVVTDKNGPWALLRLLDSGARVTPTAYPDKFHVVFANGAAERATFNLNASSVRNAFNKDLLRGFRCPSHL